MVVVQPADDEVARGLAECIPLQGGIEAERTLIADSKLEPDAQVDQPQCGDDLITNLGQSMAALGIGPEDLGGAIYDFKGATAVFGASSVVLFVAAAMALFAVPTRADEAS